MIEKGMNRIDNELEVDHFIRTQKQVRIAMKALFTKTERFLLRNHHSFVLNSSSSEENSPQNSSDEYYSKEVKIEFL